MKGSYRNKIVIGILLYGMVFSLVTLNGCTAGRQISTNKPVNIEAKKEILVASDIGGGLPFSLIRWCGNAALLIYGAEFGTEWIDLDGNKVTISTKSTDYPRDCSPDGKWVIYEDRDSGRIYKDKRGRIPENIVDEGPGWHGLVSDLYRYEISTGTRQKFAVVRDDSGSLVSPDGTMVLLGNRHDSFIEMPEPKWEPELLTNEWDYDDARWFADSAAIATLIWRNGHDFGVEFFEINGWSKEYDLAQFGFGRNTKRSVSLDAVDKEDRIYFTAVESGYNIAMSKFYFYRCEIKKQKLFCEETGGFDEGGRDINSYEVSPDGDFIFSRDEDSCIRRFRPGQTNTECIADTRYGNDVYEVIDLIDISPDGKWMALKRGKIPPKPGGRFYTYQQDLFVKELSED